MAIWRRSLLIQTYSAARPYLYHLTHRDNLDHIQRMGRLLPALMLMDSAGREDLMRTRRRSHERITVEGKVIVIRDQGPLYRGNAKFPRLYSFEDFIESLNKRIFFWPGTKIRPIPYGVRHFQHYRREDPALIRVKFESLLHTNPAATPLFCRFNSGSPRCSYGKKSPRGPNTFLPAEDFMETPSGVVEVTFDSPVILPPDAEIGERPTGPWKLLT
jgi:hypothetical protein